MLCSMTGFAARTGAMAPYAWHWELRAVNARGFDLRLRVPDWISGLESGLRPLFAAAAQRGNLSVTLRVSRAQEDEAGTAQLSPEGLERAIGHLRQVEAAAKHAGLTLAPLSAAEVLGLRGVLETTARAEVDTDPLRAALLADAATLIAAFAQMRANEGAALGQILQGQITQLAELSDAAAERAAARRESAAARLKREVAQIMGAGAGAGADPDRLAQELALLALKNDVAEELDRLQTHIAAARTFLSAGGAVGRKLDFLMQELNREANTLCAKSQDGALTQVGLSMKSVIDQMREQVQNVE